MAMKNATIEAGADLSSGRAVAIGLGARARHATDLAALSSRS